MVVWILTWVSIFMFDKLENLKNYVCTHFSINFSQILKRKSNLICFVKLVLFSNSSFSLRRLTNSWTFILKVALLISIYFAVSKEFKNQNTSITDGHVFEFKSSFFHRFISFKMYEGSVWWWDKIVWKWSTTIVPKKRRSTWITIVKCQRITSITKKNVNSIQRWM